MDKDKKQPVLIVNAKYHDTLVALLNVADCPSCDGSGVLTDNYGEPIQCQWCSERESVINDAYNKDT